MSPEHIHTSDPCIALVRALMISQATNCCIIIIILLQRFKNGKYFAG